MVASKTHSEDELKEMKRPELQKLAKTVGVKANLKNEDIIVQLLKSYGQSSKPAPATVEDSDDDNEDDVPAASTAPTKNAATRSHAAPSSSQPPVEDPAEPEVSQPSASQGRSTRGTRQPASSSQQKTTRGSRSTKATTPVLPAKEKEKEKEKTASPGKGKGKGKTKKAEEPAEELDLETTETKVASTKRKQKAGDDNATPDDSLNPLSNKPLSEVALPSASQISDISDFIPPTRPPPSKGTGRRPLTRVDTETGEEIPFASQRRAFPPLPLDDSQPSTSNPTERPTRHESEESDFPTDQPQNTSLSTLESGLSQAKQAISDLEKSQSIQASDIIKLQGDIAAERRRNDEKERELNELRAQLKVEAAKVESLEVSRAGLEVMEKTLEDSEKSRQSLSAALEEQKALILGLEDLFKSMKARVDALEMPPSGLFSRGSISPMKVTSSHGHSENQLPTTSRISPEFRASYSTPVLGKRNLDDANVSVTSSEEADASLVLEEVPDSASKKARLSVYQDDPSLLAGLSTVDEEEEPFEESRKENKLTPASPFLLAPPPRQRGALAPPSEASGSKADMPISSLPFALTPSSYQPVPQSVTSRSQFAVRNGRSDHSAPYARDKALSKTANLKPDFGTMPPPISPALKNAQLPSSQPTFFGGLGGASSTGYAVQHSLPYTPQHSVDGSRRTENRANSIDRMLAATDRVYGMVPSPFPFAKLAPPTPVIPSGTVYGTEAEKDTRFGDYGSEGVFAPRSDW